MTYPTTTEKEFHNFGLMRILDIKQAHHTQSKSINTLIFHRRNSPKTACTQKHHPTKFQCFSDVTKPLIQELLSVAILYISKNKTTYCIKKSSY